MPMDRLRVFALLLHFRLVSEGKSVENKGLYNHLLRKKVKQPCQHGLVDRPAPLKNFKQVPYL